MKLNLTENEKIIKKLSEIKALDRRKALFYMWFTNTHLTILYYMVNMNIDKNAIKRKLRETSKVVIPVWFLLIWVFIPKSFALN